MNRCVRAIGVVVFSMVIGSIMSAPASGSVIGTLNTGSSGTVTATLAALTFNNDSAALPLAGGTNFSCPAAGPCNQDVGSGTTLTFVGGPLGVQEGIIVQPISLPTIGSSTFMTFANHPLLDFSLGAVQTYTNATCTGLSPGQSCVVFPGAAILLTLQTATTSTAAVNVTGKASDTGTGGLATGSNYIGGFQTPLNQPLPNGQDPTPANIQFFFCGTNTVTMASQCDGTKSLSSTNSGQFFVTFTPPPPGVPEPESIALTMIGSSLIGLGAWKRRRRANRI